jgi:NitT/TauT family transport system ATP-binding protein
MQGVSHAFRGLDGKTVQALQTVSFGLQPATFTCLIGPSGCGKTTLLRIAAGLVTPSIGQVYFDGALLRKPRRDISIVFQRDSLLPWRTVYQNLILPLQLAGVPAEEQTRCAEIWLKKTGLWDFRDSFPAELSGGMAQRVGIARGLITEPRLLLLDEPFGALDTLTREAMWQELLNLWQSTQATVLMVTHNIREAILLADQVLVMSARPGRVLSEIHIPFSRPRTLALLSAPEFVQLEAHIRQQIEL